METLTPSPIRNTAVVIGGGLAGMAAAVALSQRGISVTIVEARKKLGGRAAGFIDLTTGLELDNCRHVLIRCCHNLIDFYKRLEVQDSIQWHRQLYMIGKGGKIDSFQASYLPAPLHLTPALLAARNFSFSDKRALARAMFAAYRLNKRQRDALNNISFMQWLMRYRQPGLLIERFWRKLIISACNEWLEILAANYGLQVIQAGLLQHRDAYHMGLSTLPLNQLYRRVPDIIRQAGGQLVYGEPVKSFGLHGRQIRNIRLRNDHIIEGDFFISAIPFDKLAGIVTPYMVDSDPRLQNLSRFDTSPIVSVHLFLQTATNEQLINLPHVMMLDSTCDWVFNHGLIENVQGTACQYLQIVTSAANELVVRESGRIIACIRSELERYFPKAASMRLVYSRVIKEKHATFSPKVGIDDIRPRTDGVISNFYLAGDWTDTGWPATMEGAVRSGYLAAERVLISLGRQDTTLITDIG